MRLPVGIPAVQSGRVMLLEMLAMLAGPFFALPCVSTYLSTGYGPFPKNVGLLVVFCI